MKLLLLISFVLSLSASAAPKHLRILRKLSPEIRKDVESYIQAERPGGGFCGVDFIDWGDGKASKKPHPCGNLVKLSELKSWPISQRTGFKYNKNWHLANGIQWTQPTAAEIDVTPEAWDFRELGLAKDVKINRQQCGDCWSQASTKAFEYIIAAREKKIENLSVQTQISSCQPDYGSCGGGYMTAPDFLVKIGNPFEIQDPYKGSNSSCKFTKAELETGFQYKLEAAPWVGESLMYSRFHKAPSGPKVEAIKAAMFKAQSPAVVTISAVSSSGGIVTSCGAINSGGNHMQVVLGWYQKDGMEVAILNNSWGTDHGQNGFTHLKWECGADKLNRGMGRSARVYTYKGCTNQPDAFTGPDQDFLYYNKAQLGKPATNGQKCSWLPVDGLSDPNICDPLAQPKIPTEYHLTAETNCGKVTAMVLITPIVPVKPTVRKIRTPLGIVTYPK